MTWRSIFRHPFPYLLAVLVALIYVGLWPISEWVTAKPGLVKYAEHDAPRIVGILRKGLLYPLGDMLSNTMRHVLIFPYWLLLGFGIRALYLWGKPYWKYVLGAFIGVLLLLYVFPGILLFFEGNSASQSKGRVGKGSIVNAKRIPYRGTNYSTYSFSGYLMGRTFVHEKVREVVLEAYQECQTSASSTQFILGETGRRHGGSFIPHRTHQNGLSVDFMTPLLKNDKPYSRHHLFNRWGYGWNFDKKGNSGKMRIDYEAMAAHLVAVKKAAKTHGLGIQKVIFDPVLRPYLLATEAGKELRSLPFTKNRVIIRHDDHYHIDFKVLQ